MKTELINRQDAINAVVQSYNYESDRMTALQGLPTVTEQEIRNKAIEEFAEELKRSYQVYDIDFCLQNNEHFSHEKSCLLLEGFIDEIAESMKGEKE